VLPSSQPFDVEAENPEPAAGNYDVHVGNNETIYDAAGEDNILECSDVGLSMHHTLDLDDAEPPCLESWPGDLNFRVIICIGKGGVFIISSFIHVKRRPIHVFARNE